MLLIVFFLFIMCYGFSVLCSDSCMLFIVICLNSGKWNLKCGVNYVGLNVKLVLCNLVSMLLKFIWRNFGSMKWLCSVVF